MTAVPSSRGCASSAEGQIQRSPASSSGRVEKKGEVTAIGCTADPRSWRKPGKVSSAERAPPPATDAASLTSTAKPALARTMAAANPLGPAPTMVAVAGTMRNQSYGRRISSGMTTLQTETTGTFALGGDLTINRLGYGAMRLTGPGI